jgi:UDPglucose 6-dehydrogenase
VSYAASAYEALEGAEALIINTEWTSFREPDYERMKSLMKQPVIFDGRNLYNPVKVAKRGFQYFYIGQKIDT